MATNYIQPGKVLDFDAPYDRTTGQGFQVGSIFAVALGTALSTVAIRGQIDGVWTLAKTSAQAWTVGQKIYWDNGNKRCDSDSTVGMLIGVAQAVAANPSSTGNVRLNGVAPATSEGPQAAEADLTDNSGGAAGDGTIGAVTAPTAIGATLTDSSGYSATHDDTIAATAALTTLTDSSGDSATHDDIVADGLTATAPAVITNYAAVVNMTNPVTKGEGEAVSAALATLENEVTALRGTVAACVTDVTVQNQNDSDLAQKIIELVTRDAVHAQNVSDVAQKAIELVTAQAADRAAIVALTDAVKEISTKVNATLAKLRIAGILST